MPFDNFFSSSWKPKPKLGDIMRARGKLTWPAGSQHPKPKPEPEKKVFNTAQQP